MARILAIDYGKKRTGIATTDNLQIIAYGLTTVETKNLLDFLKKYLEKENVETIVFGKPVREDGSTGEIFYEAQKIARKIQNLFPNIKIDYVNEAYTSIRAVEEMIKAGVKKKKRRIKANIDKMSAALILQEYLREIGKM